MTLWGASEADKRRGTEKLVDNFADRSSRRHLLLNVKKTKEMVNNFRRMKPAHQPIRILEGVY